MEQKVSLQAGRLIYTLVKAQFGVFGYTRKHGNPK